MSKQQRTLSLEGEHSRSPQGFHDKKTLLCIETSGTVCGIALAEISLHATPAQPSKQDIPTPPSIIAELSFFEPFQHDRLLAEATLALCRMTNRSVADLYAVAVSAGPGSFTGLRIGAAFAKALTFEDTPNSPFPRLLPIPTMTACAFASRTIAQMLGKREICIGIPSHKDLLYVQRFTPEATPLHEIQLVQEHTLRADVHTLYAGTYFANGANGVNATNPDNRIKPDTTRHSDFTCLPHTSLLTPRMIAEYAAYLLTSSTTETAQDYFVPSAEFVPMYAQDFVPKT
jgi:tRNA threonylcarbamoyl adenosine modification protein YeaZ